ncbi:MAG TPA: helix-turn-helix domain-containing protein [Trebonia sp.]
MEENQTHLRGDLRGTKDAEGRFLSDLRALRAQAGLDQGELAARAHYPRDVITAAESGRAVPELPVLAAYVRGCGGFGSDISEWEDRWRAVTGATASPVRQARVAGLSGAASAGAQISEASSATPEEGQDPAVIVAALHRFAAGMAQPTATSRNSEPAGRPVPASAAEPAPGPAGPESPALEDAGIDTTVQREPGSDAAVRREPDSDLAIRREAGTDDTVQGPAGARRAGAFGRTLTVVVIAAALLCLLFLLR